MRVQAYFLVSSVMGAISFRRCHICARVLQFSDPFSDVVLAETVVEEEVCERVVEVRPQAHQPVGLVRVRDLPENSNLLQYLSRLLKKRFRNCGDDRA